ncbi:MAG TPA: 2-dehydropantoate 2-reductase [Candidatus Limnocylindria bacterium]|nr:2-dehydropantoate 2-reductase [Candidatus Limnocylindria bacterium]
MRFTILGAGAIGGITGAHLIGSGHEVTWVDPVTEHLDAIREHGLTVEGASNVVARPARAIAPGELQPPLGTVLCAVKTLHTRTALAPVAPILGRDEAVLSMQNGLAYYDVMEAVGRERTLVACFNFGGHYKGPGRVVHGTTGGFHIGEIDGRLTPRVAALRDALSAVQECEASTNVLGCLWSKMAMASVFFATALVDADVKDILARERYHALMADLVAETVAASRAMGVQVYELHGFDPASVSRDDRSPEAVRRALDAIAGSFNPLQQRTGIWIDLAVRKRKTEAESQLGRLVQEASAHGVAMPLNRAVLDLILEMEAGRRTFAWENLDEVERRGRAVSGGRG